MLIIKNKSWLFLCQMLKNSNLRNAWFPVKSNVILRRTEPILSEDINTNRLPKEPLVELEWWNKIFSRTCKKNCCFLRILSSEIKLQLVIVITMHMAVVRAPWDHVSSSLAFYTYSSWKPKKLWQCIKRNPKQVNNFYRGNVTIKCYRLT